MPTETFLSFFPVLYRCAANAPFVVAKFGMGNNKWLRLEYGQFTQGATMAFDNSFLTIPSQTLVVTAEMLCDQKQVRVDPAQNEVVVDVSNFYNYWSVRKCEEVHTIIAGKDIYDWVSGLPPTTLPEEVIEQSIFEFNHAGEITEDASNFNGLANILHEVASKYLPPNFMNLAWSSVSIHV